MDMGKKKEEAEEEEGEGEGEGGGKVGTKWISYVTLGRYNF